MIVLDTHVWLWFWERPGKLSKAARRELERSPEMGIPAICMWEVAQLVSRNRFKLDRPVRQWLEDAFADERFQLLPLLPSIADEAASFGNGVNDDPCDRMIVATALVYGCALVTADSKIHASDLVQCIW